MEVNWESSKVHIFCGHFCYPPYSLSSPADGANGSVLPAVLDTFKGTSEQFFASKSPYIP